MKINYSILIGLIMGILASITWYAIAVKLDYYTIDVYVYRLIVLFSALFIGVPIAILVQKKKENGFIEFNVALKTGLLMVLTLTVIYAMFNTIYHKFICPDAVEYFVSEARKFGIANKIAESEIQLSIERQKNTLSSSQLFLPAIFIGLILSLLSAAIFQKKNPAEISSEASAN
jgi:drug/metabolite transporter (DMT)-like permease